jgi:hypothetical protein
MLSRTPRCRTSEREMGTLGSVAERRAEWGTRSPTGGRATAQGSAGTPGLPVCGFVRRMAGPAPSSRSVLGLSRRKPATTARQSTDQAGVCLTVPPLHQPRC